MKRFLSPRGQKALSDAIVAIEERSSAEVVIAVRPSSGRYLHADLLAGAAAAFLVLALLLFSPWPFALGWILVDPLIVGVLVTLAASRFDAPRRLLTNAASRRLGVERAAAAVFLDKHVHQTLGRTGLLVYISLLERSAAVVCDVGVEAAVPEEEWARAVADIDRAVAAGGDAVAVAAAVEKLGDILELTLERAEDDVNELADEVCAG